MPLEHLEDAPRVQQRRVDGRVAGNGGSAAAEAVRRCAVLHGALGGLFATAAAVLVLGVAVTGGRGHLGALVLPGGEVVLPFLGVVAGEQPVAVLRVAKVLAQDCAGVGVGNDVVAEVLLLGEHMVHQRAEQHDVRARAQRNVQVSQRAGAGEPRVDMNDGGAFGLRFHHPLEPDRVTLGHVGTLDDDAVRIL